MAEQFPDSFDGSSLGVRDCVHVRLDHGLQDSLARTRLLQSNHFIDGQIEIRVVLANHVDDRCVFELRF